MANTTNLDLVKPAGTDKALVSVINANSDKIDSFAGTTNQALAYLEKPTQTQCSSLDDVKTAISSAISGMADNEVRRIVLSFSSNFAPFYSQRTVVELYRANANNFSGIAFNNGATTPTVEIKYTNSTWYFNELALKSETVPVYKDANSNVISVESATWAELTRITLPKGTWLIIGEADYNTNLNGIRILMITYTETDTRNLAENSILTQGRATLSRQRILRSTGDTTVYLRIWHSAGTALSVYGSLKCIRINDSWTT